MKRIIFLLLLVIPLFVFGQTEKTIEVGSFNIEWFPCKDNGELMKKYNINLRRPPSGKATDIPALFNLLKKLDIELLGVVEVVDPALLDSMAKKYLGPQFKVIYAPSKSSQRVGFLYDSSVLELVGQPEIYGALTLDPNSWLRPALRGYFKVKPDGFDFNAIIAHLKAAPSGWKKRKRQWRILENILQNLPQESGDKDIVLMGDFNNVSKRHFDEFRPIMKRLNFFWATSELAEEGYYSNYWQPDYSRERIEGSLIDQIFISSHALQEYVPHSVRAGGMCAQKKEAYEGDEIPDYYKKISDHCPVFVSFKAGPDND